MNLVDLEFEQYCTEKCRAPVTCAVCGLRKKPWGRDAAAAMASSLCDHDCPGYDQEPKPGHLWPGEAIGSNRL